MAHLTIKPATAPVSGREGRFSCWGSCGKNCGRSSPVAKENDSAAVNACTDQIATHQRVSALTDDEQRHPLSPTTTANALGFASPPTLLDLPIELWDRILAHLRPCDAGQLASTCRLACERVRNSAWPWRAIDVFLHGPEQHFYGTQRLLAAWPRVRFIFKARQVSFADRLGDDRGRFGLGMLRAWLELAQAPNVVGLDLTLTSVPARVEAEPAWSALLQRVELGFMANSLVREHLPALAHLVFVDLSYSHRLTTLAPLARVDQVVAAHCPNLRSVEGLACSYLNVRRCFRLHRLANLPQCRHLDARTCLGLFDLGPNIGMTHRLAA
ncbi:uncharacterized protein MONBRDRAFT_6985 [Monosiga brevicollis MX1]|uniref:F-box domain-containing protein n=1 Tax=Monosiga brevicollis TaxID=81824 RepID=A9UVJ9_MONBE|nr:uncharacterized protein MONBRDRAFT_6985 [Monosiga brevicollis MX1]EDQ90595.1 predicted protein [Monosiga brevicollis MX1]|eukprot:XP_001744646.1 hypothetical protein [Monosiga brevicollis MX1]